MRYPIRMYLVYVKKYRAGVCTGLINNNSLCIIKTML